MSSILSASLRKFNRNKTQAIYQQVTSSMDLQLAERDPRVEVVLGVEGLEEEGDESLEFDRSELALSSPSLGNSDDGLLWIFACSSVGWQSESGRCLGR